MPFSIARSRQPARRADSLAFLRAWISNPLRVAAVAPSGRELAELMTSEISAHTGPVLELGPGTGAFTRGLISRGVAEDMLTLVELDAGFASLLVQRFPEACLLRMDAARLEGPDISARAPFGAVVSGLPLLSMPSRKVAAILSGALRLLRPDGAFYQFTYGPAAPVPRAVLDRLGVEARRIGFAFRNLPPASAYRFSRLQG